MRNTIKGFKVSATVSRYKTTLKANYEQTKISSPSISSSINKLDIINHDTNGILHDFHKKDE